MSSSLLVSAAVRAFGENAIRQRAEGTLVQDLMGHKTDVMTRHVISARKSTAAAFTPKFTLA